MRSKAFSTLLPERSSNYDEPHYAASLHRKSRGTDLVVTGGTAPELAPAAAATAVAAATAAAGLGGAAPSSAEPSRLSSKVVPEKVPEQAPERGLDKALPEKPLPGKTLLAKPLPHKSLPRKLRERGSRRQFSVNTLMKLLELTNGTIIGQEFDVLEMPFREKQMLEKIVDALSRLTADMVLDELRFDEGLARMQRALNALEGYSTG